MDFSCFSNMNIDLANFDVAAIYFGSSADFTKKYEDTARKAGDRIQRRKRVNNFNMYHTARLYCKEDNEVRERSSFINWIVDNFETNIKNFVLPVSHKQVFLSI